MPVQVPTVERMNAPEPASVGRIDYRPADPLPAEQATTRAAEGLGEKVDKYVHTQQIFKADTISTAAAAKYHMYLESRLEGAPAGVSPIDGKAMPAYVGVRNMQGDPDPAFKGFHSEQDAARQSLIMQADGENEATKRMIQQKLSAIDTKFYDRVSTAYTKQNADFITGTANSAVGIAQRDVVDSTAHYDPKDPNTLVPLDATLQNMENLRLQQGLKLGSVHPIPDPTGALEDDPNQPGTQRVKVVGYDKTPQMQLQMAKDKSDALKNAITNMIASGNVDGAKSLNDRYASSLDPVNRAKIETHIVKAEQDQKGMDAFNEVRDLPYADAMKQLKEDVDDDKVRASAMAKLSTYRTQMENAQTAQAKDNFVAAGQIILAKRQAGKAYVSEDQMLSDPAIKQLAPQLNPEQIKALSNMVKPPDTSDTVALTKAFDLMKNGNTQLKGMAPADLALAQTGLDQHHRTMLENSWKEYNTQSPAQKTLQTSSIQKLAEQELLQAGLSNRDVGIKKNSYGKYSNKDQIKLNELNQQILSDSDTMPDGMSQKDRIGYVKGLVADKLKETAQSPGFFGSILGKSKGFLGFGGDEEKPSAATAPKKQPTTEAVPGVNPGAAPLKAKTDGIASFMQVNKRLPKDATELKNFLNSRN